MSTLNLINMDMEKFCKLFAKWVQNDNPYYSCETLFHFMFQKETYDLVDTRQRNAFRHLCTEMVKHHQYFVLLEFLRGSITHHDKYNLSIIYDEISQIQIREGYNLAQLCVDYAREVQAENEFADQIPEGADLFHDFPEDLRLFKGGGMTRHPAVRTLMNHVYQLDYADEQLTSAHIDALVQRVREASIQKYEAHCAELEKHNKSVAEYMSNPNRLQAPEFTTFERDHAIPNMLVPFLAVADLDGDHPLRYYILEKYVMPALAEVPWERTHEHSLIAMAQAAYYYADYLQWIFYSEFPFTEDSRIADPEYLRKDFYFEAIGKSSMAQSKYTGEHLLRFCRDHSEMFRLWANVLDRGGKHLKEALNPNAYSFYMLHVPYILFFGGHQEEAAQFLLRHYSEMSPGERRKPHCPILLARSILASSRSDTANALYGLFSYELGKPERERETIVNLSYQMLDFMQKSRTYILNGNECTLDEDRPWFDILFGDGKLDNYLQECRAILDVGEVLPARKFDTLSGVVGAFAHPTGVYLAGLGLPKYDNYDKLPNALSPQLKNWGQGCAEQSKEAKVYYVRAAQVEPLRNINLHLQNHLFKLQRKEVEANLARVQALKQTLPEDATDQEREKLLADIAAIANDMTALIMGSSLRPEAERKITALRQDFEEKYLQGQVDLMQKLPEKIRADVHNYLVTSNMVFSMMEARDDDSLDYSAALISMTKALELVMVHVYSRLNVHEYEGIDEDTLKYYFQDGKPVTRQTLRPCIETLKTPLFEQWGVDEVLDVDMLRLFDDISVQVGANRRGEGKFKQFTSGDDAQADNREILRRALGYICQNYRNRSAHPDVVTLMQVKECQQLLIDGQKLLWVLLAILKQA